MPIAHEEGFFTGVGGERLYMRRWAVPVAATPPKAVIALVHGYLEHCGRYGELGSWLAQRGFGVYGFDQRGHGRSGGPRGFVQRFDDVVGDIGHYLTTVRLREGRDRPLFLVGHSFGGLVAATYAILHPADIAGLVLSSPYMRNKVPVSGAKLFAAKVLSRVTPRLALDAGVNAAALTHDPEIVRAHDADPLVLRKFTTRWSTETLAAQDRAIARAAELRVPLLVMQGMDDQIADPVGAREFYDRVSLHDREWRGFDGFYHEIFNEVERAQVYAHLLGWVEKRA